MDMGEGYKMSPGYLTNGGRRDDRQAEDPDHQITGRRVWIREDCPGAWHIGEHGEVVLPQEMYERRNGIQIIFGTVRQGDPLRELRTGDSPGSQTETQTIL